MKKSKKLKSGGSLNVTYLVGLVCAIIVFLFGCVSKVFMEPQFQVTFNMDLLINFFDPASILITIGCTVFMVVASFPGDMLKAMPVHMKMVLHGF